MKVPERPRPRLQRTVHDPFTSGDGERPRPPWALLPVDRRRRRLTDPYLAGTMAAPASRMAVPPAPRRASTAASRAASRGMLRWGSFCVLHRTASEEQSRLDRLVEKFDR